MKTGLLSSAATFTLLAVSYPVLAQTPAAGGAMGGSAGANATGSASTGATAAKINSNGTINNSAGNNTATTGINANGTINNSNANASANNHLSWQTENAYWRNNYATRPYYNSSQNYSVYEPAYRYGVDLYNQNPNMTFDSLNQSQISNGWAQARGSSNLNWNDAQQATRDAYNRMAQSNNRPAPTPVLHTTTR